MEGLNLFQRRRETAGMSYKAIADELEKETGKSVSRNYIYKIITSPGRCKDLTTLERVGAIIGISKELVEVAWWEARKDYLNEMMIQKMKRGGM